MGLVLKWRKHGSVYYGSDHSAGPIINASSSQVMHTAVSENQGPAHKPQMVGLLFEGRHGLDNERTTFLQTNMGAHRGP